MSLASRYSFTKQWNKALANPCDFSLWTNLLDLVEKQVSFLVSNFQQNLEHARKAFDSFFTYYPYCYGYWKKFAEMERHNGDKRCALEVYRRGVQAVPLSVDLWTAYLDAAQEYFQGDDSYESIMRNLYEEALSIVGMEFRSDALWEHYISWECGHNRLSNVVEIYTRLLKVPTQLYFQNWDSFTKLVEENSPESILSKSEFANFHAQVSLQSANDSQDEMEPPVLQAFAPSVEITDEVRNSIRKLVIESKKQIYQATSFQIMKRWYFEEKIRRPYFHVKPLEEAQLLNWAEYLSFEEAESATTAARVKSELEADFKDRSEVELERAVASADDVRASRDRVRLLYERCLVPCSLYEHFWIRYAKYLECTECDIPSAREVWRRACSIHLRYKPTAHWHWALFEDRYPANLDEIQSQLPVKSGLDILTELEERLTDSAMTCGRRADAMRRAGKPLFDIITCLRSGINRLRFLAAEQSKLAQSVSGTTASRIVAQAVATSSQARAGAGLLSCKLARLLHHQDSGDGIPAWMLMLSSRHCEEEKDMLTVSPAVEPATKIDEPDIIPQTEADADSDVEMEDDDDSSSQPVANHDEDQQDALSPPVLLVASRQSLQSQESVDQLNTNENKRKRRRSNSPTSSVEMEDDDDVQPTKMIKVSEEADVSEMPASEHDSTVNLQEKKHEENVNAEEDLEGIEDAATAALIAEEERIQMLLKKRHPVVQLEAPLQETLTDSDRESLTYEDAAVRVLKEAIEFDPRNERLYIQLLDVLYQRRPVDVDAFLEAVNLACIESVLPASIKLAFCQRKLQFLEEFDSDVCRLNLAYEEYLNLCQAVNAGLSAAAVAQGQSRMAPAYPLPDLLNLPSQSLRVAALTSANPADSLTSAGPVGRQSRLNHDLGALEAAASVGTPVADPSTVSGQCTVGAYEPLAAALGNTSGLPPAAPHLNTVLPASMTLLQSDPSTAAAWSTGTGGSDAYAAYYYGLTNSVGQATATNGV